MYVAYRNDESGEGKATEVAARKAKSTGTSWMIYRNAFGDWCVCRRDSHLGHGEKWHKTVFAS